MAKVDPKYHGITNDVAYDLLDDWKDHMCSQNVHAFDEVLSGDEHYLHCDACGLIVYIDRIETGEQD